LVPSPDAALGGGLGRSVAKSTIFAIVQFRCFHFVSLLEDFFGL
jgi:hypothetical protein